MVAPVLSLDTSGNPYVEVFFDNSFDVDVSYLRVVRLSDGREWPVRGGVRLAPGVATLDFEASPGQCTYRAEMFSVDGASLGWTEAAVIDVPDFGVTIHNPLDPTVYVRLPVVAVTDAMAGTIERPTVGDVVYTEGRTVGTRVGSRRRGLVGLRFGVALESTADADTLQGMVGGYDDTQLPVLCVRTPLPLRIPRTLFASVSDVTEVDVNVRWGGSQLDFLLTGTEVEPPFPGLAVPLLSYDDLDAAYDTYDDRDAAYASYTDMDRDYSLAGLAG